MFASNTSQVSSDAVFVEDIFNTTLYTGNGSTQTITNGIDLAGKGGLVWWKNRTNATGHGLIDTTRGIDYYLSSNTSDAQDGPVSYISSVSSTGYSIGAGTQFVNQSANNYVSWTFRKAPKFFDVVTYTGNGTAGTAISHSLGSTPGFILVKRTDTGGSTGQNWVVWHRSAGGTGYFNSTNALDSSFPNSIFWGDGSNYVAPTSTTFTVTTSQNVNASGGSYVAYLFAHNAGGFGLTGTDNVISCGSYTGNGSSTTIDLGYEPQWLLIKSSSSSSYNWVILDNMRGLSGGSNGTPRLYPNSSGAEAAGNELGSLNATGFTVSGGNSNANGVTYIYIAIRRGPMKVPTSGTSVLQTLTYTGNGSSGRIYSGVTTVPDLAIATSRSNTSPKNWCDRLRGENPMISTSTDGESGTSQEGKTIIAGSANGTVTFGSYWGDAAVNTNGYTYVNYLLSRAPSFFDEVCYTGTGSQQNITHNLGVAPELMIVKRRSAAGGSWATWATSLTADQSLALNTTDDKTAVFSVGFWGSTYPTSSVFTVGSNVNTNSNTVTYVAYLFATCAGVSKVFSYTGNGSSQTINCGFTGGARWILIKRTDSTGDWYVWDSARGIVSGNDPHLSLNTTAAEVTTDDTIDTDSTGFVVNQVSATNVNVSSATYIGIAIA